MRFTHRPEIYEPPQPRRSPVRAAQIGYGRAFRGCQWVIERQAAPAPLRCLSSRRGFKVKPVLACITNDVDSSRSSCPQWTGLRLEGRLRTLSAGSHGIPASPRSTALAALPSQHHPAALDCRRSGSRKSAMALPI